MKEHRLTHLLNGANKPIFFLGKKKPSLLCMTLCLQEELFNHLQAFTSILKPLRTT